MWDHRRGALRRRSLSHEAAETLRNHILVGDLAGIELRPDDIARRLGTSVTPAREALRQLVAEGLIDDTRGRGFHAVVLSRRDIEDVYRSQALLAGELAARACAEGDPGLAATLRRLHVEISATNKQGRTADAEGLNWELHRTINRAAGAPTLALLLRATLRFVPTHIYQLIAESPAIVGRGHRSIVEAFEADDPDAARAAAAAHIEEVLRLVMAHFADDGYWARPSTRAQDSSSAAETNRR
jgi:DNA-binding GntR family transcriptional regulator